MGLLVGSADGDRISDGAALTSTIFVKPTIAAAVVTKTNALKRIYVLSRGFRRSFVLCAKKLARENYGLKTLEMHWHESRAHAGFDVAGGVFIVLELELRRGHDV